MSYIGLNIKKIREAWKLTQTEFGLLIDASRGMVMQYEKRGTVPKGETLSKVSSITGFTKDMLLNTEIDRNDIQPIDFDTHLFIENYRNDPNSVEEIKVEKDDKEEVSKLKLKPVPYFDIDVSAGTGWVETVGKVVPDAIIYSPSFQGCDLVVNVKGDSMASFINPGSYAGIKRITDMDVIHFGIPHVVVTQEQAFLKYLRYNEIDHDIFILRSHNNYYQDIHLHKSKIKALFSVKAVETAISW